MNRGRPGTYAEAASFHWSMRARYLVEAGQADVYSLQYDDNPATPGYYWYERSARCHGMAMYHGLMAQEYQRLDECSRRGVSP